MPFGTRLATIITILQKGDNIMHTKSSGNKFKNIIKNASITMSSSFFLLSAPGIDKPSGKIMFYISFALFELWIFINKYQS